MGIKITKQLLQDYDKIKREIPLLRAEINEMQHSDSGLGSSTIIDYHKGFPRPQAVVGFDQEKYERRVKRLREKERQVAVVEEWIENIEDDRARLVFQMFYIKKFSWTKIAKSIGYAGNADYVRLHIRDKYLKKQGIK